MAIATKQIAECMTRYEGLIRSAYPPFELLEKRYEEPESKVQRLEHLLYMCLQVREWCETATEMFNLDYSPGYHPLREKIMRWLSWIQAKLHSEGLLTMEQCKRDLMPPAETFRADGGVETKGW